MPLAGQILRAADFDGFATVSDSTDETAFNSTAFTLGGTTVGTAFVAPTSGAAVVLFSARGRLNVAAALVIIVSAEVRTGSTVGSGTVVLAAGDDEAVQWGQDLNTRVGASQHRVVSGLTAGDTYNVSLWHRNTTSAAGAGTLFARSVSVMPWLG